MIWPFAPRRPGTSSGRPFAVWSPLIVACSLTLSSGDVLAQWTDEVESPQERTRQFDELAREVSRLEQQANILKKVVRLVRPTVVHIEADKSDASRRYGRKSVEEAGSGTIIELSGKNYILTNRHVIKQAAMANIRVRLSDGRQISPTNVWGDPATDIAVMAVSEPNLVSARIGDSDAMEIGDFVLAVGSPFGLSQSVTYGIISAKGRRDLELGDDGVRFQDFLQTDAAINPGNSGGPLINLRGEVIGMNTAIASSSGGNEGIGFTIPVNMVMLIARQLVDRGSVVRAFLGVNLDSKFNSTIAQRLGLSRRTGAHISGITANSPAEAAALAIDDVILEFNGIRVDDDNHLINMVGLTEVGREIPLAVFRDGKMIRVKVKVGDRSKFPE